MSSFSRQWRPRLSVRWGALISLAGYGVAYALRAGGLRFIFGLLFVVFGFLVVLRLLGPWRRRMLWRLRNRLVVTYFFIAVIPILLVVGMVALTAYLLYGQLAGYLIASDLESKAKQLGTVSLGLTAELVSHSSPAGSEDARLRTFLERERASLGADFPQLSLVLTVSSRSVVVPPGDEPVPCASRPEWAKDHFRGVVISGAQMFLHASAAVPGWPGAVLCLTVPAGDDLLAQIGTDTGRFRLLLLEEAAPGSGRGTIVIGNRRYASVGRIETVGRALPPRRHFFDPVFTSVSKFDVVQWDPKSAQRVEIPVFLYITTRPSLLNQRLFAPLGEVAQVFLEVLAVSGVVFLLLQVVSLITGIRLSRRITSAINDLYAATQRLQAGDFSVRVPHRREDQLGALGESFNQMAASIERSIEESKQRQRLENELEIARQVQEQLFPRQVPPLKTLALVGRCRPARVVSGDYYDYGLAEPGRLIFTIGDISGKGISAALLMASIQSILRSQVYASQLTGQLGQLSVAELVTRVNRLLCATTSTDKFSTLFVGFYDDATRQLTYTNAGHLAPVLLRGGNTQELATGGPVVGLFRDLTYEQATVELQPGDWLVAYTDGLTEVENSYEEEYGNERLIAFLERHADSAGPEQLIEAVMAELQQWAPGVEQSDDRTLLVARAC